VNAIGAVTLQSSVLSETIGRRGRDVDTIHRSVRADSENMLNDQTKWMPKSGHATLWRRHSTARVSKRPTHRSPACLRARYCADLTWLDL